MKVRWLVFLLVSVMLRVHAADTTAPPPARQTFPASAMQMASPSASGSWTDSQALSYIASYPDLIGALGVNAAAGRAHYSSSGQAEGRKITFEPLRYLALYADVRAAYGTDVVSATTHFIQHGFAEGRRNWSDQDALLYIASYEDLVRALGTDVDGARRHYAVFGQAERRQISFNPLRYVASYPDLIRHIGPNPVEATIHYINHGFHEGRVPSFDELGYTASYPDLLTAFRTDAEGSLRHFILFGFQEGRRISFSALEYIATYPDLIQVFGFDTSAATRHYIEHGYAEGRRPAFSALRYIASYADLIRTYATDTFQATRHFIAHGWAEGRKLLFNAANYLAKYEDLRRAFGSDTIAATTHFIRHGFSEGRTDALLTYTLQGRAQKGPFILGSAVSINEQSEGLVPTGKVYNVQTTDDLGNFSVPAAIGTHLVELIADGFYLDELTGQLAGSRIQLRAIADLAVNPSPTINILTALQARRLAVLISQGTAYSAADAQSQREVLAVFGIDSTKITGLSNLYSMRIDGTSDSDAVLLATSVVLSRMATNAAVANGSSQPAELTNYINSIAAAIATSGSLNNSTVSSAIRTASAQVDIAAVRSNVEGYYARRGVQMVTPRFEEWIDIDGSGVLPRRLLQAPGLSFVNQAGLEPNQVITSNSYTVSGLDPGVAVGVTASGAAIVKNGVEIVGRFSTARNGDTLALRRLSPGYALTETSTLQVGLSSANWAISTRPLGGTVRRLSGSGLVLLSGTGEFVHVPAGASTFSFSHAHPTGTTFSVVVQSQPRSPDQSCTIANGTGIVGSNLAEIVVSCIGPISELPFADVTGVGPQQTVTSDPVVVSGIGSGFTAIATADPSVTIVRNGIPSQTTSVEVMDGDTLALRTVSLGFGMTRTVSIAVATKTATWRVVTKPLGGSVTGLTGSGLTLTNGSGELIAVPAGATSFHFSVPVPVGSSFDVRIGSQPTSPRQICSVGNGVGTVGASTANVSVACSGLNLGFAIGRGDDWILPFAVTPDGKVMQYGDGRRDTYMPQLVAHPSGRYLYAGTAVSHFFQYRIQEDATLQIVGSYNTGGVFYSFALSKDGGSMFIAQGSFTGLPRLAHYSINPDTGVPAEQSLLTLSTPVYSLAVDPGNRFVIGTGRDNQLLSVFGVAAEGGLVVRSTISAGAAVSRIELDSTGTFLYVSLRGADSLAVYRVDASSGTLALVTTVAAGLQPDIVRMGVGGNALYVSSVGERGIWSFAVDKSSGLLTRMGFTPTAGDPNSLGPGPDGKYLYVSEGTGVSVYSIDPGSGALGAAPGFTLGSDRVKGFVLVPQ